MPKSISPMQMMEFKPNQPESETYETIGLGERIRSQGELIWRQEQQRRHDIKVKALGYSALVGTGAAVGYGISQLLN